MGEISNIEWCDSTFNPWEGCQKVGPGCDNCYAEARNARWNGGTAVNWGPGALRRRTSPTNWKKPKLWNRDAAQFFELHGRKRRVFCASLADVFDNAVEVEWRLDLFKLIEKTPNLDWLLLTKRIGNVPDMLPLSWREGLPPNVWLGISVVTQEEADRDIPKLFDVPAGIRFLSCEPLLERISFDPVDLHTVDWVIVGGESGPKARDNGFLSNARWIRDQCAAAGVPFFGKQGVHKAPLPADLDVKQFPGFYYAPA
jgi:protein gp37